MQFHLSRKSYRKFHSNGKRSSSKRLLSGSTIRCLSFQSWNFQFFLFKKNLLHLFFQISPVSSSVSNKRYLWKKLWGHRLSSKIDATDGNKWVRFVAMQQNSAALNTSWAERKVQWRVTLKKIAQPFKMVQFHVRKISNVVLEVSKQQITVFSHLKRPTWYQWNHRYLH